MYFPATSRPYVYVPIDGPVTADIMAGYVTEIAIIADDGTEPADADYHLATWLGDEPALLVGPGTSYVYPSGDYMAFARITAGDERLVLLSGRIRIGEAA